MSMDVCDSSRVLLPPVTPPRHQSGARSLDLKIWVNATDLHDKLVSDLTVVVCSLDVHVASLNYSCRGKRLHNEPWWVYRYSSRLQVLHSALFSKSPHFCKQASIIQVHML